VFFEEKYREVVGERRHKDINYKVVTIETFIKIDLILLMIWIKK